MASPGQPAVEGAEMRIDEMVGLLDRLAPERLSKLQADFPAHVDLLAVGQRMGETKPPWELFVRTAVAVLAEGIPKVEKGAEIASVRLHSAARLALFAQCVALAGAATTAGLAIGTSEAIKTSVAASITLLANIVTLVAQHQRASLFGDKASLTDHYVQLTSLLPEMRFMKAQAEVLLQMQASPKPRDLESLISRANSMSKDAYIALRGIPGAI